ncbi:MAG: potassium channel family protein [Saonia sp.]
MVRYLYERRFEFFLITQVFILFGSLFVPYDFHENILLPILFLLNISSGILLISKKKKLVWFFVGLFIVSAFIFGNNLFTRQGGDDILIRMSVYFIFHIIVTWNIIQQVWGAKFVDKNVIMGLMSGYISLGFLAFFLFLSIELVEPGSFQGALLEKENFDIRADGIMYYAFITLLTIGYGEIIPATPVAQKAAILTGLIGQFYIVIITAVVVGKYIKHSMDKNES